MGRAAADAGGGGGGDVLAVGFAAEAEPTGLHTGGWVCEGHVQIYSTPPLTMMTAV